MYLYQITRYFESSSNFFMLGDFIQFTENTQDTQDTYKTFVNNSFLRNQITRSLKNIDI